MAAFANPRLLLAVSTWLDASAIYGSGMNVTLLGYDVRSNNLRSPDVSALFGCSQTEDRVTLPAHVCHN